MWRNSELLLKRVLNAANAPEAVEAENDDIDENAAEAGDSVNEHVACTGVAADYSELVNFIECAVDGYENDWVENLSVLREANWMKALNETCAAIAESAKEEEMSEFTGDFVRQAKQGSDASGFGIGNSTVVVGERPNY